MSEEKNTKNRSVTFYDEAQYVRILEEKAKEMDLSLSSVIRMALREKYPQNS